MAAAAVSLQTLIQREVTKQICAILIASHAISCRRFICVWKVKRMTVVTQQKGLRAMFEKRPCISHVMSLEVYILLLTHVSSY